MTATPTSAIAAPPSSIADRIDLGSGALTGEALITSLVDGREVWSDGRRVDVTTDPVMRPMLDTLAQLFDHQWSANQAPHMLYRSETSGNQVSLSYLAPRTPADLDRKWANSERWSVASHGQLSRLPDFMANVVVGLYDFRHRLAEVDPEFGIRAENYYHYCRENDIVLTHGLGDPQIDRSSSPMERPELGLQVIDRSADGIVVRGAKQIATLAAHAHEILIYLSPANYLRHDPSYVCWFAAPIDTPGLRVLCRPSFADGSHRLGARFDEQDALIVFDDVFVPSDRVFLLDDAATAAQGFHEINKWSLYAGQIRLLNRLRTMLGVASLLAQAIGVHRFRQVEDMLGELTSYVEVVRLGLAGINGDARRTESGLLSPGSTAPLDAVATHFSARASAIIREIGASGLVMQPSPADMAVPELQRVIDTYLCGRDITAAEKTELFRLASDLVIDRFGMRQELYETWNRGNPASVRSRLYATFPGLRGCEAQVQRILETRREWS